MLSPRSEPFPFEAVRDLLGILRALYAARRREGASRRRLRELGGLGRQLRAAVDLALEHEPGTLGHAAAWERAERAVAELGALVDATTPIAPTLEAAARRVRDESRSARGRDEGRLARKMRG
ncbi:MAG: hypothetical protein U0263_39530 [Polyangiaceae bacterium]